VLCRRSVPEHPRCGRTPRLVRSVPDSESRRWICARRASLRPQDSESDSASRDGLPRSVPDSESRRWMSALRQNSSV